MNKQLYRIIFSKTQQRLVVVSEIATGEGKAKGEGQQNSMVSDRTVFDRTVFDRTLPFAGSFAWTLKTLNMALYTAFGFLFVTSSAVADELQIRADQTAPKNQQAIVLQTANGLPQVNIQTPNDKGLSHNKYQQFDVAEKGAILNNSRSNVQTEQGGWVQGNPYLARGEAKVILNEVNASNPSQLKGYVEVAGQRADVIIANPAGINCQGCGTINAGRTTLTTGQVELENGMVKGYQVEQGKVTVSGRGMDTSRSDYTDIIAKETEINAGIWAKELKVTTGQNKVSRDNRTVEVIHTGGNSNHATENEQVRYAVDVSELGGMYAGKIHLVGTEDGLGVRNAGHIGASQGNIQIDSQGQIVNSGFIGAQTDVTVTAKQQMKNTGTVYTQQGNINLTSQTQGIAQHGSVMAKGNAQQKGRVTVKANGAIEQRGETLAEGDIDYQAKRIEVETSATLAAGITFTQTEQGEQKTLNPQNDSGKNLTLTATESAVAQGQNLASNRMAIQGQTVDISNSQTSANHLNITATTGDIVANHSTIQTQKNTTFNTPTALFTQHASVNSEQLQITAARADNSGGSWIQRGTSDWTLNLADGLTNNQGQISTQGHFSLNTATLQNRQGVLDSGGHLRINSGVSGELNNQEGVLSSRQTLDIKSGQFNNQQGLIQSAGDMEIDTHGHQLDNRFTLNDKRNLGIISLGNFSLNSGQWENTQGYLASLGTQSIALSGALNNTAGHISALADSAITGVSWNNTRGTFSSHGALSLNLSGDLNGDNSRITSQGAMQIDADKISQNNQSLLHSDSHLVLNAKQLHSTQNSEISAQHADIHIQGSASNSQSHLLTQQALNMVSQALDNQNGIIASWQDSISLNTQRQALNSQGGKILANRTLTIQSGELNNQHGLLQSGENALIDTDNQTFDNRQTLTSERDGGLVVLGKLTLNTGTLLNEQGYIASRSEQRITAETLDNRAGVIQSNSTQNFQVSATLNNQRGQMIAAQDSHIRSQALENSQGLIRSGQDLVLNTQGYALNNAQTLSAARDQGIIALGKLTLETGKLDNQTGFIASQGGQALNTAELNNRQGIIQSAARQKLAIDGLLDNTQGQISADDALTIQSQALTNIQGLIQSSENLSINTQNQRLDNSQTLSQNGNQGIIALGELTLNSGELVNQQGYIGSRDKQTLVATKVDNQNGAIQSQNQQNLTVSGALNNNAGQLSATIIGLTAAVLENQQGTITAADTLDVKVKERLNNTQGKIASGQNNTILAGELDNSKGIIGAEQGGVRLTIDNSVTNRLGKIMTNHDLIVSSQQLDNRQGQISSLANLTLDTRQYQLLNDQGQIIAQQAATLQTGKLFNRQGLISGTDGILIDTHRNSLNNSESSDKGIISGNGHVQLKNVTAFNNQHGTVAGKQLTIASATADNSQGGSLYAAEQLALSTQALDNRGGIIQAVQSAVVSAADTINNRKIGEKGSLIQSGGELQINTAQLDNSQTKGTATKPTQGLIADTLTLSGRSLNNQQGGIYTTHALNGKLNHSVDNRNGEILSLGSLNLQGDSLALSNQKGNIESGGKLNLTLDRFIDGGSIKTQSDAKISLKQDLTLNHAFQVNGTLDLSTQGNFYNRTQQVTGAGLSIRAQHIDNPLNSELSSQNTQINANSLENRGLIDGALNVIKVGQLNNLGTGRIYGDHLAIQANTLRNDQETVNGETKSATIAARERLDLGIGTLYNLQRTLDESGTQILSLGNMTIGRYLDDNNFASGKADLIINDSARIESLGSMSISSVLTQNQDSNLVIGKITLAPSDEIHEVKLWNTVYAYDDVNFYRQKRRNILNGDRESYFNSTLASPDDLGEAGYHIYRTIGGEWEHPTRPYPLRFTAIWTEYKYKRQVIQDAVVQSNPGKILSGGSLILDGDVDNQKGKIIVGDKISQLSGSVNNEAAYGEKITRVIDGQYNYHDYSWGSLHGVDSWSGWKPYAAADIVSTAPIFTSIYQQHAGDELPGSFSSVRPEDQTHYTAGSAANLTIDEINAPINSINNDEFTLGDLNNTVDVRKPNYAELDWNNQNNELALSQIKSSNTPIIISINARLNNVSIRTYENPVKLPTGSLYRINNSVDSHVLVETDPAFADKKRWLSSDMMLEQLRINPDSLHKRLGDGFYEQQLVRDQINQLTGRRFLDGYSSDNEQYKALMNSGVVYAEKWQLVPGVALTASQIAELTSDIIWLVEKEVTLADGSQTKVLSPQVYVHVKEGDFSGANSGVISAKTIDINTDGDITNKGIISGRELTTINAKNIMNEGGQFSAESLSLSAKNDLTNLGGLISANKSIALSAGNNLNMFSTTQEAENVSGQDVFGIKTVDRIAKVFTSGDNALIDIQAGNDLNLVAFQMEALGNNSKVQLKAGNNLTSSTVTTGMTEELIFDERNFVKSHETKHQGSHFNINGDIGLSANNDVTLANTDLLATGKTAIHADNHVNLTTVTDSRDYQNYHHESFRKGHYTSKVNSSEEKEKGSTISGQNGVSITSGNTITATAANITSQDNQVLLHAKQDITLDAGREHTSYDLEASSSKRSTLSKKSSYRHDHVESDTGIATAISGQSVLMAAGNDINITGSSVVADNDINLLATRNIDIQADKNTYNESHVEINKKSGLGASLSGGMLSVGYSRARASGENTQQSTTLSSSLIQSKTGNLTISADGNINIAASALGAGKDIVVSGSDVQFSAMSETQHNASHSESKQKGFGIQAIYNPVKVAADTYNASMGEQKVQGGDGKSLISSSAVHGMAVAEASYRLMKPVTAFAINQSQHSNQQGYRESAVVSEVQAGGHLTVVARDKSIRSEGAHFAAEGDVLFSAKENIVLNAARDIINESANTRASGNGYDGATTLGAIHYKNKRNETGDLTRSSGSTISTGGSARLDALRGDIISQGSQLVSAQDMTLNAGGNIVLTTTRDFIRQDSQESGKGIGKAVISDTERFAGYYSKSEASQSRELTHQGTQLGSLTGNVTIHAQKDYQQTGSDVVANQGKVRIEANKLTFSEAVNEQFQSSQSRDVKIGAFAKVKSPLIDLAHQAEALARSDKSDERLMGLQSAALVAKGYSTYDAARKYLNNDKDGAYLIKGEVGVGFSTASHSQHALQQHSSGNVVNGAQGVTLIAREGNIDATDTRFTTHDSQGNRITGATLDLQAADKILLNAGESHDDFAGKQQSSGMQVGTGYAVGGQTGWYVYAEAGHNKNHQKMNRTTYQNTLLDSDNIVLKSGGDTVLSGAQAHANQIITRIGGDLLINSLQDHQQETGSGTNLGGRVQVSFGTAWEANANISAQKGRAERKQVSNQSGLFAEAHYDVEANNVHLNGGAITGNDTSKNRLATNSFTFNDIQNSSESWAASAGLSGGAGHNGNVDSNGNASENSYNLAGSLPLFGTQQDNTLTKATLSEGTIILNKDSQPTQTTAAALGINTDTQTANVQTENPLNIDRTLAKQAQAQSAISDIQSGITTYNKNRHEQAQQAQQQAEVDLKQAIEQGDATQIAQAEKAYERARLDTESWGTGGSNKRAVDTATAVITTLMAGGSNAQVATAALSPEVNRLIKQVTTDENGNVDTAKNLILHGILSAIESQANGGNALAGAAAGITAEAAANVLAEVLYNKEAKDLTDSQRQNIIALSSAVGGIASATTNGGNSTITTVNDVAIGVETGKRAVENNYLLDKEIINFEKEMNECTVNGNDCTFVLQKYLEISNENRRKLKNKCSDGGIVCVAYEEMIEASTNSVMAKYDSSGRIYLGKKVDNDEVIDVVKYLNFSDLDYLKKNISTTDRVLNTVVDPTSWPLVIFGTRDLLINTTKESFISAGLSMGVNAGMQYTLNDKDINLTDLVAAGLVGKITSGKGYDSTVSWNTIGGFYTAKINGDNPGESALLSRGASSIGYSVGSHIQKQLDSILNPISKQYEWIPIRNTLPIMKPASLNNIPSRFGSFGDSIISEMLNQNSLEVLKNEEK